MELIIEVSIFKGVNNSTALSGLGAEVLSRSDLMTIDEFVIRLARKVQAGRACEKMRRARRIRRGLTKK